MEDKRRRKYEANIDRCIRDTYNRIIQDKKRIQEEQRK